MIVRPATTDDLDAIAALHGQSWRSTYRGIMPDDFLDGPVEDDRISHWYELMEEVDGGRTTLVAETDDGLAGFVSAASSSEDGVDAYIEHIHVRPTLKGAGIGRRLLAEAADRLVAQGHASAYLLVFSDNRQAIRFYERLGGVTTSDGTEDMAGTRIARSRVGWRDLAGLAMACRGQQVPADRVTDAAQLKDQS